MATPADRQVEANEDVERIAAAMHRADIEIQGGVAAPFSLIPRERRERYCAIVRRLLLAGVIRVGRRPQVGEPPMEGQTSIETGGAA